MSTSDSTTTEERARSGWGRRLLLLGGGLGLAGFGFAQFGVVAAGAAPASAQTISVSKTASGTGAPLSGAVFWLYNWHGSCDLSHPVATATSDATGVATFSLAGHHNYCVVEKVAPSGYTLSSTPVVVKTAHQSNGNLPANIKDVESATFVDDPIQAGSVVTTTTTTTTQPTGGSNNTTTTTTTQPVTGGSNSTTTPPSTASAVSSNSPAVTAGSSVPGATAVHTGLPWAGSTPYAVALGGLGSLLLGSGMLLRRRTVKA